jgi:SPP1 gp7 family putative phage head morphogenesis protein
MAEQLADMVKEVYQSGGRHSIDMPVVGKYIDKLWQATQKGFGAAYNPFDYDTPDTQMLAHLMANVYTFSAAKNQQQLRALTNALIGDNGKLRSFSEFKQKAFEINDKHVNQWLKAEYNLAVAGGQMASKWVRIQESAGSLPMLQFDAVMDKRTSELCAGLNGVIKPINDPFWNKYYPPNHFGCRSTVRQLPASYKPTPDGTYTPPEIPPMFQTNLGKAGLIFPPGHSYYNNVAILSFGDANFVKREFRQGRGHVYDSGRVVNDTKLFDVRHIVEVEQKKEVADFLANHYDTDVFLLPEFSAQKKDLRYSYFFRDSKPGTSKQPDFFFNGKYWEMEGYEKEFADRKITTMLNRGAKQGDYIILHLRHQANLVYVKSRARGALQRSPNLKHVKGVLLVDYEGKVHDVL